MTGAIQPEERRARLAERHHLLPRARVDSVPQIAEDLVALHSSDPVTVYLSVWTRMTAPSLEAVEQALYVDRTLLRHHAMRRTLWVATPTATRLMHAAATRGLLEAETRRTCQMLAGSGIAEPRAWLTSAYGQVLTDLRSHGPSTARELGQRIETLRLPLRVAVGTRQEATLAAHTRVLLLLGFRGDLLRTRPTGTWVNGAYRYAAADAWVPGGLGELDVREAAAALAELYLQRFGPVTTADLQWWMGWTVAMTKRALADARAAEVDLCSGSGSGWVASGDVSPTAEERWVAVLPSLDPTTMGWKQRDWYLPEAAAEAFDRNGNAGPTLWVDGRVVGAWAQTRAGEIRTHYFERVAAARRREIDERIADLARVIGPTRFSVRFPGRINAALLA